MENNITRYVVNNAKPIKQEVLRSIKSFALNSKNQEADKGRKYIADAARLLLNSNEGSPENLKGRVLLNAAFEVTIPSKVEADLTPILSMYAEVHSLTVNGVATINRWELDKNGGAGKIAKGASAKYQVKRKARVPVTQEYYGTVVAMDYRDLMDDPDGEYASILGEAAKDTVNQVVIAAQDSLVDGLKAAFTATEVGAIFLEASGIIQASIDTAIAEVRTGGGKITAVGDYRVVKQITAFTGINNENSERTLMFNDENGYVGCYNGMEIGALDNFYDYSQVETLGSAIVWAKQLSKANVYIMNAGKDKHPNHMFLYGKATTFTGRDVANGIELVRVDQSAGPYFAKERTSHVVIVSDTDLQ